MHLYIFEEEMHIFAFKGIGRIIIHALHFLRVVAKVVKFPLVNIVVEVDEFEVLGAYAVMTLDRVLGWIFIIVVIHSLTPVFRGLAFQDLAK